MDIYSTSVTVAGCGAMGLPMALCLQQGGFQVQGYDVRPCAEFGAFSAAMQPDIQAVTDSTILISVVRDETQTDELCFGEQGVFNQPVFPSILVVSSTLSPRFINDLARRLPSAVCLVDAPMSGAPYSAQQGSLTFMVGGPADAVATLMPLFHCMGSQIFCVGETGSGMTMKVLNNYAAASSVVVVRRVYDMARALGVETAKLREIMAVSSGASWFGNNFPLIDWSEQGYQQSNTIGILEKDVLSALDALESSAMLQVDQLDRQLLESLRTLKPYK